VGSFFQPSNFFLLAQAAALASLGDGHHVRQSVAVNNEERSRVAAACGELGLRAVPSVCNFVLVDVGRPAKPVFEALLKRGVIVRPVGNYELPNHLRITIGTPPENERLIEGLGAVVNGR
jgi:histidinol-phosphate aminotransferase